MFYIHKAACISPQKTFESIDLENLEIAKENKLQAIEPAYTQIPAGILRRMGKAVRIGVGAALPLLEEPKLDGTILGTANGGLEDCIKFLNQIIEYKEGTLTPTNFVQSTSNAIASQIAIFSKNKGYNITHVHRGLAFENAIIDAIMLLRENPENQYLVGGVDEISSYNYNIEYLKGWYKKEPVSNLELYDTATAGSVAGEGAAMFVVSNRPKDTSAYLKAIHTLHSTEESDVARELNAFIAENLARNEEIDLLLSGENGDNRLLKYYLTAEALLKEVPVARFKHMTGEYETVSAIGLWIACQLLENQLLPAHMTKTTKAPTQLKNILIYNTCKGYQHSFILISKTHL